MWPGCCAADGLLMIDETLLADPRRCPSCAALLRPPVTACPACRLPLSGPTAGRLWAVSTEAARLLGERARLVGTLRAEAEVPAVAAYVAPEPGPAASASAPPPLRGTRPPPPRPPPPPATPRRLPRVDPAPGAEPPARPRRRPAGRRRRDLRRRLVGPARGRWPRGRADRRDRSRLPRRPDRPPAGPDSHRRGPVAAHRSAWRSSTAAVRRAADLFGLREADGLLVAAGSTALVAALAAAGAVAVPTRSMRVSAAVLGQLPLPLVAVHLADASRHPGAVLATAATLQTVALLGLAARWPGGRRTDDARLVVAVGGVAAGAVAVALSLGTAYGEDGSLVVGTALLLLLAGLAGGRGGAAARGVGRGGRAGCSRGGAGGGRRVGPGRRRRRRPLDGRRPGRLGGGAAGDGGARAGGAPARARRGPARRGGPPGGRCPRRPGRRAVTERLENVHLPWSTGLDDPTLVTTADWGAVLVLVVVAAVVALAPLVLPQVGRARPLAVVPAAGAVWLVPAAVHAGYRTTLVGRRRLGCPPARRRASSP